MPQLEHPGNVNSEALGLPYVSVVMPVRNEEAFIHISLGAVLAQDYPRDCLEVLVVDGMSDDETRAIVTEIAASDARVRLLENHARIIPTALNIGIATARGEFIVRVDGHTVIEPDYITQCVHHLQRTGADNVGGPMQPAGLTPMGEAIAAATSAPFGIPTRFHHSRTPGYVDTVYMGAWPRAVFERVGGYDETLTCNEDYELNYRIRASGGRVFFTPAIRSTYYCRQTLRTLWQQYLRYGVCKSQVVVRHPASTRPRHLVAPAFVMALAAGAALTPFTRRGRWLLAAVAGSYALANLAASTQLARQRGWRLLLRVPAVFATIHVAWGAGFWRGVLQQARGLASRRGAGRPA